MTLADWLDSYARAWEERDPEAVVPLFSEHALYHSHRFGDPHVGRQGIAEYWRTATDPQENVRVRFGEPVVDGPRVAVEWWTTATSDGEPRTVAGCLFLRFDSGGLCEELRECWHTADGLVEPPAGWGR
jgi:hypothetical protein